MKYPATLTNLIRELSKLPGIGPKSAQRLAFFLFSAPNEEVKELAEAITKAKETLRTCPICFNVTESDICVICADDTRDKATICVVEEPSDVMAIERSGEYSGLYHVLHGVYSPMQGIGPDQLRIEPLMQRLTNDIHELILATSTTVEGEATAMYLIEQIKPLKIPITRIAYGLPVGGALEYADEITLGKAMAGRQKVI